MSILERQLEDMVMFTLPLQSGLAESGKHMDEKTGTGGRTWSKGMYIWKCVVCFNS